MYSSRAILETHLRCAECGSSLHLAYEKEARLTAKRTSDSTSTTGAAKVEISVFVEPCKVCMEPATRILKAVEILQQQGKN